MATFGLMPVRLVVSDVDGTLVTPDKVLSAATITAARRLRDAGIPLALVSSRPTRGMAFLVTELALAGPFGGFNGSSILTPDGTILEERFVPEAAVRTSIELFTARGVDVWLFAGDQWLISGRDSRYDVARERRTVRFDPTIVDDFEPYISHCGKIVGASSHFDLLAECESDLQALLAGSANARRSQRYYLDVTNPAADKGTAAHSFAEWHGVDIADVCAIGDQENDVPMFRVAGHSIAMGNAPPAVAAQARHLTASNEQDGWAAAIERFVLPVAA